MARIASIVLAVSAVLLIAACSTPAQAPPTQMGPVPGSPEDLTAKTVALVRVRPNGRARAYCTGVWVAERVILTAKHCLPEDEQGDEPAGIGPVLRPLAVVAYASKADILRVDGTEEELPATRQATVLYADEAHDLALLETKGRVPQHGIAVPIEGDLSVGQSVTTMGHPYGLWWSFSQGEVASVRTMDLEPTAVYVQTTAPTSIGNSGGGLWDKAGRLVGIAHAGIPAGANLAFYVHPVHVRELLERHKL